MEEEYMLDYQHKTNLILWDYQNSGLARKNTDFSAKIGNIIEALGKADMRGGILMKVFSVEGDYPAGFELALTTAAAAYKDNQFKLEFINVPNMEIIDNGVMRVQKEIVDFEVVGSKIDLMLSSPSPLLDVNLILISNDGDFSRNLAELRRRMCNIVVVIGQTPGLGLAQNADIIWKVKDFMKGEGPIYMKRTLNQIGGRIEAKGSLSALMRVLSKFNEERIKPCAENISAAYVFNDVSIDEAVKFKKLFLERSLALYRLPQSSICMFKNDKKLQDFGTNFLKKLANFLLNREETRDKLIQCLNCYLAAIELRKDFPLLERYYLSDLIALITIMAKDLKWIRYRGTNLNLKIDAFKLNTINNFYHCAAHDDSDDDDPVDIAPNKNKKVARCMRIGGPESNRDRESYVAWDYISMPMNSATMGIDIEKGYGYSIPVKMSDALRKAGFQGPLKIVVYSREDEVANDVKQIFTQADIKITKIEITKEGRRDALHSDMTWDTTKYVANLPVKANVILITGNVSHSSFAQKLRNNGHHVTLVRPLGERVQQLNTNADLIWLFNDLIRGLPPLYNKKGSPIQGIQSSDIDDIGELLAVLSTLREEKVGPTKQNITDKANTKKFKFKVQDTLKKARKLGAIRREGGGFYWLQNERSWMCLP